MTDNTPEQHAPDVSQALSVPSEESLESPLLYLKIPNGYPEDDKIHTVLDAGNEPSEEVLRKFFTPEVIQRLAYCPKINRDETDDWGMFGYEPGYIFVCGTAYEGARSFNDQAALIGKRGDDKIKTASGVEIYTIPHYDFFPRRKFINQKVTAERTPKTFAFLRSLLENVDPNDISTYPTDDLGHELEGLRTGFSNQRDYLEMAEKYRKKVNDKSLSPVHQQEVLMDADRYTRLYEKAREQIPQNIEKYLILVREFKGRKEVTNPSALRLFGSFKDEQISIQAAIDQARQRGDNELANAIEKLQAETGSYREDKMYLVSDTNKKTPKLNNGK